jgi:hypothetical protein
MLVPPLDLNRGQMNAGFLSSSRNLFKKLICIDTIRLADHLMDYGSIFTILFGLAFVVFGLTLYVVARRTSPDR